MASFDNADETTGKTFVRAATQGERQASGELYKLQAKALTGSVGSFSAENRGLEMHKRSSESKETEQTHHKRQVMTIQRPKKRRAIDEFLEEMKERGPAPISLEKTEIAKGSFDDGNPDTTNLYVGNLAPTITEEVLEVCDILLQLKCS